MIISVLILAPQLSGIGAITAYAGLIFEASGSELDSSISIIIVGVIQFVSGVLGMFCVDLLGRRPLMMFSICGSTIFLIGKVHFSNPNYLITKLSFKSITTLSRHRRGSVFPIPR